MSGDMKELSFFGEPWVFFIEVMWVTWVGFESEGKRAAEVWLEGALP